MKLANAAHFGLVVTMILISACAGGEGAVTPTVPTAQAVKTDEVQPTQAGISWSEIRKGSVIQADNAEELTLLGELFGHSDWAWALSISPDDELLASGGGDGTVRLWSLSSGNEVASFTVRPEPAGLAFSPDGSILAVGGNDAAIHLWDVTTGEKLGILEGHAWGLRGIVFHPEGSTLVSGSVDETIRIWDVAAMEEVDVLRDHQGDVNSVDYDPTGTLLASGSSDKAVIIRDFETGERTYTLRGHTSSVNILQFSPDGELLVTASGDIDTDPSIILWDVSSGEQKSVLTGHAGAVFFVEFSPDGSLLASTGLDGTLRIWEVATGVELIMKKVSEGFASAGLAFSSDGKVLFVATSDSAIEAWGVQ